MTDRATALIAWIDRRTAHINDPRDRLAQQVGMFRAELRKAHVEIEVLTEDQTPEAQARGRAEEAQHWENIARQDEARDWARPV